MNTASGEFRRGWRPLLASSLGIACGISPIPVTLLGHLTRPLQAEFGWTRGQIMLAVTFVGVTNAAMTPVFGWLIDRVGVRRIALISLVGFALCWMGVATNNGSITLFYASWVAMALVGSGSQPISWTRMIGAWFDRRQGLALGIALTGTGLTAVVLNAFAPFLIREFGWRGAIVCTAVVALGIALPVALAYFREPTQVDSRRTSLEVTSPTGVSASDALRGARFWLLFAIFGGIALAYVGLLTNYVPLLIDRGFTPVAAGTTTSIVGLSIIVGRIGSGYLFDRLWRRRWRLPSLPVKSSPACSCIRPM